MRCTILLWSFIICNFCLGQLYTFRNYSHKDGLSISSITSAINSQDGTIILGSEGAGLIRYDGYAFHDEIKGDFDKDHHVTSMYEENGNLYFTSQFKGLFLIKNDKLKKLASTTHTIGDFQLVQKFDSVLFVAAASGFYIYENNKLNSIFRFGSLNNNFRVESYVQIESGAIITTTKGAFHISEKSRRVVPLKNWLHITEPWVNDQLFAYKKNGSVFLIDKKYKHNIKVVIGDKGKIYKISKSVPGLSLEDDEEIIAITSNYKTKKAAFVTNKNEIYFNKNGEFQKIIRNYSSKLEFVESLLIDDQENLWILSRGKGLYKISQEPFTKIEIDPVFKSSQVLTLFKSSKGDILISTVDRKTTIGSKENLHGPYRHFELRVLSVVEYKNNLLLGTDEGLKSLDLKSKSLSNISIPAANGKKINFIFEDDNKLWVGIAKDGIHLYDLNANYREIKFSNTDPIPGFFYTAQLAANKQKVYLGSNNGVYVYSKKNNFLKRLPTTKKLGSYVGVSTKDSYGNNWFTFDRGILGILKNEDTVQLTNKDLFPSKLFYTLSSDNYGNLLVGTNKGINVISLDEYGNVLKNQNYDARTGFEGYETNMRAQFQKGNLIYVGTIEGVFLINANLLHRSPAPNKPIIKEKKVNTLSNNNGTIQLQFIVNNPKYKGVKYTYRIPGYKSNWSELTTNRELLLTDLPNGLFTIEVKSTYDGHTFSEAGTFDFRVHIPFWKSRWFVFLILVGIIIFNIVVLTKRRIFRKNPFFNTKDTGVIITLTPQILLFGAISDTAVHLITPMIDPNIHSVLGITLVNGFILLGLYFMALTAKANNQTWQFKNLLIAGFLCSLIHNEIDLYLSNLDPFFVIAILLLSSLSCYIFERIRTILVYVLLFILINVFIMIDTENSVYNETLFLIAIFFSAFLNIFTSYLRYDSLEKLLFVSGIVNKGNVPTIAFNREGIITYTSENIFDVIQTSHDQLIGQHISFLNTFVPDEGHYRKVDLTNDFQDGKKYLVPMVTKEQDIKWMEWSCKFFTENIKVIMGQNVTDRLELENTYEMLVQTAEDMIYQCDVQGFFRFLNHRCYEKWGYSEEELTTRNSLTLVPDDYVAEVSAFYRRHFQERLESSYYEFPIQTKSGFIIWVGQHVTTIFKPGDKKIITGFLALARDITYTRKQQEIIKTQRDDITASINYARKIQVNLFPSTEKFSRSFDESLILYKPKDIVSGDFYWMEIVDDTTVIALADCTGHGVPGSFMTLLGINLLNNIVLERKIMTPGTILNELDRKLVEALPSEKREESLSDGMEITICVINHKTSELSYACAGSRFLVYENNSFTMYKGDTKHIGDRTVFDFKGYITHFTKMQNDAVVYMFTDGFQDQFGGVKNKKYSFRRMIELFESNIRLPLSEQELMIEEEFEKWKSMYAQTDDVSIIAFTGLKDTPEDYLDLIE